MTAEHISGGSFELDPQEAFDQLANEALYRFDEFTSMQEEIDLSAQETKPRAFTLGREADLSDYPLAVACLVNDMYDLTRQQADVLFVKFPIAVVDLRKPKVLLQNPDFPDQQFFLVSQTINKREVTHKIDVDTYRAMLENPDESPLPDLFHKIKNYGIVQIRTGQRHRPING